MATRFSCQAPSNQGHGTKVVLTHYNPRSRGEQATCTWSAGVAVCKALGQASPLCAAGLQRVAVQSFLCASPSGVTSR